MTDGTSTNIADQVSYTPPKVAGNPAKPVIADKDGYVNDKVVALRKRKG